MYYALINMRSSCAAMTALAWGSLKEIADTLISECEMLMENTDDMSIDELEADYYCEFDDFKALSECEEPTADIISNFSFTLSDCTTVVCCLVEGYHELVKAFDAYKEDKWTLDCWRMVPEIEETDENLSKLDEELRMLNDDLMCDDYEFFIDAGTEDE